MSYKTKRWAFFGLGSNRGDRFEFLLSAARALQDWSLEKPLISPVFETPPWGFESDTPFLNCCMGILTDRSPHELLVRALQIEDELGRTRESFKAGYTSRCIDIDLLYVGDEIVDNSPELLLPHPRINQRKFVLEPLESIAPDFVDPLRNKTIATLLNELNDDSETLLFEKKLLTIL